MIPARKTYKYTVDCIEPHCNLEDAITWDEARDTANEHRAKTGHAVVIREKTPEQSAAL